MTGTADRTPMGALPATLVLALTGAGVFISALDQTVVVTALPEIFVDIELPVTRLDQGAWIVTGYLVGYTAAMPLVGRVSDIYGHGRIYSPCHAGFHAGLRSRGPQRQPGVDRRGPGGAGDRWRRRPTRDPRHCQREPSRQQAWDRHRGHRGPGGGGGRPGPPVRRLGVEISGLAMAFLAEPSPGGCGDPAGLLPGEKPSGAPLSPWTTLGGCF